MRPSLGLLVLLSLAEALWPALPSSAQEDKRLLRSEFWADLRPVPGSNEEWPVGLETARARLLAEAAWVYGGMIWGFEFAYTPSDRTRAIEERFDIEPIQGLGGRDLSLAAGASSEPGQFRSFVEYRPSADLVSLMEGYAMGPWRGCQGIGRADMDLGVGGRRAAYVDGLRAALRALLQGLEPNKPRLARGRVVFDAPPSMAIIGGYYVSQVRARAMVVEAIPYKIY